MQRGRAPILHHHPLGDERIDIGEVGERGTSSGSFDRPEGLLLVDVVVSADIGGGQLFAELCQQRLAVEATLLNQAHDIAFEA